VQGIIPLRNCTACMSPQANDLSFQINSPGRIWFAKLFHKKKNEHEKITTESNRMLQAETAAEAQKWLKALQATALRATVEENGLFQMIFYLLVLIDRFYIARCSITRVGSSRSITSSCTKERRFSSFDAGKHLH
jgi:hypothetical protein